MTTRRKVGKRTNLSQRITKEVEEGAMPSVEKVLSPGPAGNLDYIAHESSEHAVLHGFADKSMKAHQLDTMPMKEDVKKLIIESHRRGATTTPGIPDGCPPKYSLEPDGDVMAVN